ncbi:hypothetical protein [Caldichromatium japonicum]|uniref:hypothetical protein n=1 Tax=Caldichromatium japonicum TaxID=2699430 RepID=UPI001FEA9343|nr:hypothetical protein [Caldichromatium japonicum]
MPSSTSSFIAQVGSRTPTVRGLEKAELDLNISLTQLLYASDQEVLAGGKWDLNLMVPVVDSISIQATTWPFRSPVGI